MEIKKNLPVAVVTGGSQGIGAEIVKTLAENNFKVVLNYCHSKENAEEIATFYPNNVVAFKADVSQHSEVNNLINFTTKEFEKIDLLVNNAGIDLIKTINNTSNEDFESIMKTNLFSAFYASREASKYMISQKSGLIINISSIWGLIGASCEVAYSISKAGLDGLTKSLAKELGPSNIRVNSISPGIINTKMNKQLSEEEKENIIEEIPLGRIGSVRDVAKLVIDLYDSPYITGQVIQVNGGWNI